LIGVLVTAILVAWVVWTYQKVISEADRNTYEFLGFGKKDFKNGQKYFRKAKTLNPFTIRFLICAPIIIFVPRLYVKLLLFIRRNKNFKNL